jgi:hypothetical protein
MAHRHGEAAISLKGEWLTSAARRAGATSHARELGREGRLRRTRAPGKRTPQMGGPLTVRTAARQVIGIPATVARKSTI